MQRKYPKFRYDNMHGLGVITKVHQGTCDAHPSQWWVNERTSVSLVEGVIRAGVLLSKRLMGVVRGEVRQPAATGGPGKHRRTAAIRRGGRDGGSRAHTPLTVS